MFQLYYYITSKFANSENDF